MLWQPKDAAKTKKAREAKKSQSQQGKESKDNVFVIENDSELAERILPKKEKAGKIVQAVALQ